MFTAVHNHHLVPFDGKFDLSKAASSAIKGSDDKKQLKNRLQDCVSEISELQRILYAHNYYSILLIFQAMDSAGKDSTIRAVTNGLNPAGCQVYSFKQPSAEELDHDFLWRTTCRLPERGRIGIFNRSYYEEVLVVKVHPEYLRPQRLLDADNLEQVWQDRYQAIRDQEHHLAKSGTLILKFWLNVSKQEQKRRFISRLEEPEKHWKFSEKDIHERTFWDKYMAAYEHALNETSRPWAPWYAIPADNKPYMRLCVAETILASIKSLDIQYPTVAESELKLFKQYKKSLENES